jgi:hypothetical protein
MKKTQLFNFFLALMVTGLIAACESKPELETTTPPAPATPQMQEAEEPADSTGGLIEPPDTTGASVWAFLQDQDYQANWSTWPGKGMFYEGQEPHGMLLTTYLNENALVAITAKTGMMPDGAVIVKENYQPDSTLAAITVMYKVAGFNPEHSDWFFSKHLPTGALERMPDGRAMEGRVPGCQSCHSEQKANDYLFTGSIQ